MSVFLPRGLPEAVLEGVMSHLYKLDITDLCAIRPKHGRKHGKLAFVHVSAQHPWKIRSTEYNSYTPPRKIVKVIPTTPKFTAI